MAPAVRGVEPDQLDHLGLSGAVRQPEPFAKNGSFPSENPILLSLIWIVVIVGVFAPLAVRRYRSMSR